MRSKLRLLALGAATMLSLASTASADFALDLTGGGSGSVTSNDFFSTNDTQPTGSGVIQSFVRISAANQATVQGYNTDARPLQFDENSSPTFTRALPLSAVPVVNIGGTDYRQFLLDINQQSSDPLLTLRELQIFVGNTGSPTGATVGAGGTLNFGGQASLIYDLDTGGDNQIELDYNLNSGSGSGDMFAYIKDSLFTGSFVTLYSMFGPPPNDNNDGYEEWAVRTTEVLPVPLPMAAWGGIALCGFLGVSKLRRRQQVD